MKIMNNFQVMVHFFKKRKFLAWGSPEPVAALRFRAGGFWVCRKTGQLTTRESLSTDNDSCQLTVVSCPVESEACCLGVKVWGKWGIIRGFYPH